MSVYKDTDRAIIPHAALDDMTSMIKSGVFEIGSHTHDMHQSAEYEAALGNDSPRIDVSRLADEDESVYLDALRADFDKSFEKIQKAYGSGDCLRALAYPRGVLTNEAAALLRDEYGVKMTFSTEEGIHTVVRGLGQSLYGMKRFNVDGYMTADDVLAKIGG